MPVKIRRVILGTGEVAPPPVDPPDEPPIEPPVEVTYGALPIGSAVYSVPAGAKFVAPNGNNANAGTQAAPWATLKYAATNTPAGGTIVARGGTYHEGTTYNASQLGDTIRPKQDVTIMNYPGEAVWIDGSQVVTAWTADGARWRTDLTTVFDRTPTTGRGNSDASAWGGGGYVNANFPVAHWPETVFYDGQPLRQVQTIGEVVAGTFFAEGTILGGTTANKNQYTTTRYWIGSTPVGHEVRVGTFTRALNPAGSGVTLKGIGFRRFAVPLADFGIIYNAQEGLTVENCYIGDASSGVGLSNHGANLVCRKTTFERCGQTGVGGQFQDNALFEYNLYKNNVSARFNFGPDAGGMKITRCRNVTVRNCMFDTNYGHALWFDESVDGMVVANNVFDTNYGYACNVEISQKAVVVGNLFIDNGILTTDMEGENWYHMAAIWISGSDQVRTWNNTFVNCPMPMQISQGYRRASNPADFGRDPRRTYPDPNMTWIVTTHQVKNNLFGRTPAISPAYFATHVSYFVEPNPVNTGISTSTMGPDYEGNLYNRVATDRPQRLANGSAFTGSGSPVVTPYYNLDATWRALVGGDEGSAQIVNVDVLDADNRLKAQYVSQVTPAALPADIAAMVGQPTGTRKVGAFL